jgi:hypothetical protein
MTPFRPYGMWALDPSIDPGHPRFDAATTFINQHQQAARAKPRREATQIINTQERITCFKSIPMPLGGVLGPLIPAASDVIATCGGRPHLGYRRSPPIPVDRDRHTLALVSLSAEDQDIDLLKLLVSAIEG